MARITRERLTNQASRLSNNLGTHGVSGKTFKLNRAYGRWTFVVVVNESGGIRTLSQSLTTSEMSSALDMTNQILEYIQQESKYFPALRSLSEETERPGD